MSLSKSYKLTTDIQPCNLNDIRVCIYKEVENKESELLDSAVFKSLVAGNRWARNFIFNYALWD